MFEAIMKAADQIKSFPRLFQWANCIIPSDCGTPGCALGWIAYFSGANSFCDACTAMGIPLSEHNHSDFYERMTELAPSWKVDANLCAEGLRLYAEKYHGDEKFKVKTGTHPFVQKLLDQPSVCPV